MVFLKKKLGGGVERTLECVRLKDRIPVALTLWIAHVFTTLFFFISCLELPRVQMSVAVNAGVTSAGMPTLYRASLDQIVSHLLAKVSEVKKGGGGGV